MRKVLSIVVVLTAVLVALIALRIRAQTREAEGPASGSGVIEAEGLDLASRLAARVTQVRVAEGEQVAAGAVVLELDCEEPQARLAEVTARLSAARAQADAALAQAAAAKGQSAAAQASVGAAGAQAQALQAQHALAQREAERYAQMGEQAAPSARDRASSTATGLAEQERAAVAAKLVSMRQAGASESQAQAARDQAEAAALTVKALEAQLASAQLLVDECVIRAPRAGVIERVYYDPGELVSLGGIVARLVDPSDITITFYLANTAFAYAKVGKAVRVVADAYPGETFHGEIERVALEAEFTPRNVQTKSDRDRLVYPVKVRVKDPDHKLRTGMQAVVTLDKGTP